MKKFIVTQICIGEAGVHTSGMFNIIRQVSAEKQEEAIEKFTAATQYLKAHKKLEVDCVELGSIGWIPSSSDDFNNAPAFLKEISLEEWTRGFFSYCLDPYEYRQVKGEKPCDLRMFDLEYETEEKMGFAIMRDWFDPEKQKNRPKEIIRFCRYGSDEAWEKFKGHFAAQFAGDNS